MARIIYIVNQKGGTGKSACTANLAVGLAQKNMKVLIVDTDHSLMYLQDLDIVIVMKVMKHLQLLWIQ